MRVYWDTSAAINAAVSAQVFHRLIHAVAAQQAGADVLLTRNVGDFAGLTGNVRVEQP